LNQLEKIELPHFQTTAIASYVTQSLPLWRERIRKGARSSFDDFFMSLRERMTDIGRIVMSPLINQLKTNRNVATISAMTDGENGMRMEERKKEKKERKRKKEENCVSLSLSLIHCFSLFSEDWSNNSKFSVRFSSLYQCISVYQSLGLAES
jgi:hypothetical protein